MDKITYAKKFLKDKQETKEMYQEQLFNADKKYIGEMLEKREEELTKWIDEIKVEIEMAEKFIKDTEDFEKFDADMSKQAEAEEREQERQADNAQEHAQEMRAQYEEELRSEGTDN